MRIPKKRRNTLFTSYVKKIVNTGFGGTFVVVVNRTVGHRALLTFTLTDNVNVLSDCKETVPKHEKNLKFYITVTDMPHFWDGNPYF